MVIDLSTRIVKYVNFNDCLIFIFKYNIRSASRKRSKQPILLKLDLYVELATILVKIR